MALSQRFGSLNPVGQTQQMGAGASLNSFFGLWILTAGGI
jgi:hypothetical protein